MDSAEALFHYFIYYRTPPVTDDIHLTPMKALFAFVVGVVYVTIWFLITNVFFMLSAKNEEEVSMSSLSTEEETENF